PADAWLPSSACVRESTAAMISAHAPARPAIEPPSISLRGSVVPSAKLDGVNSRKVVAVDANPAARPVATGTETYAREVPRRLPGAAPELAFRFYASRPGPVDGLDLTVLPGRRLWSQLRLPVELMQRPPDLFFAPSHVVPFLARGRALTVVHDLAFDRHPEAY